MTSTGNIVCAVLGELAGVAPDLLEVDTDLRIDLGFDSLSALEAVMELEERFGFVVDDRRLAGLRTVGDVISLADQLGSSAGPVVEGAARA